MTDTVLAVDDEVFNLDILRVYLQGAGYNVLLAKDGVEALQVLKDNQDIKVIVLDRMMPNMDGISFMREMKYMEGLQPIPVIMQTAAAQPTQIQEGIDEGVYYYLTKPYEEAVLLSLVRTAIYDYETHDQLRQHIRQYKDVAGMVVNCEFTLRTLQQAQELTVYLANFFPEPERVVPGLWEMMANAVEHGNLDIGYELKSRLNLKSEYPLEVLRRLQLPENLDKRVMVRYEKRSSDIAVTITDQGKGFNWRPYLEIDPSRLNDTHGRGIAMARKGSFDSIEYQGSGNRVVCKVSLKY